MTRLTASLLPQIVTIILGASIAKAQDMPSPLPTGNQLPALAMPHFPDRLHAYVWRNWGLVPPEKLAAVVSATPDQIRALAASMGLPQEPTVSPLMMRRGYITLLKRNWELLPYEQLLSFLDISAEELAFRLREDDFLFVKLGLFKPRCETLAWVEPDEAARKRAAGIRSLVQSQFGDLLEQPQEPRFGFLDRYQKAVSPPDNPPVPRREGPLGLRFLHSYFASYADPMGDPDQDPFPEGLLSELSSLGVNGVWLHVVLRQLAPGVPDFPEFGAGHEERLKRLSALVARAKRWGISVFLYINEPRAMPPEFFAKRPETAGVRELDFIAMCTSAPAVTNWIKSALEHVFREVPDLGGVFTITASENLTNCASHNLQKNCPRCSQRDYAEILAEVNAAVEAGVHRASPSAKVIAWDWGWHNHTLAPDVIALLPKSCWLQSVSEWSLPIERGGIRGTVGEYSLSCVGPGPRALAQWASARDAGLKTSAKVQLNNTWELSAVPFLPVLELVAKHCKNLANVQVDGLMLSWSLGGAPSPNLQVARTIADNPRATIDEILDQIAHQRYGPKAVTPARQAWKQFSDSFQEYPYSGATVYNGPQQLGPANLLHLQPTGRRASMVGFPYDDLDAWRAVYPRDIFAAQFQKVADGWNNGLSQMEQVVELAEPLQKSLAQDDLRIARAAGAHLASVANQARFVIARDRLAAAPANRDDAVTLRQEMVQVLEDESRLARLLFQAAREDSRIGFEASNQYYYVPQDLIEKAINVAWIKDQLAKK